MPLSANSDQPKETGQTPMSVIPIDLGPKPVNRSVKQWRFWHRLAERLDALVAYPVKNAVSEQELRRVDEDTKHCRELMSENSQQDGYTKLAPMRWAPAIRTVKIR
jgi:hypothetical protein